MEALKIAIRDKAIDTINEVAEWYNINMGKKSAQNFVDGIWKTINLLSTMPTIGIVDKNLSKGKRKYYSFLSHPKYRVVYRFTKRILYIVAIRATMMNK